MSKICGECGERIGFDEYSFDGKCEKCHKKNQNVQKTDFIECKKCSKEISQEETQLYNGYCENCYKESKKGENEVANIIRGMAILIGSIGILCACVVLFGYNLISAIIIGAVSIITAILIYGYAEIIQLLEDIKNK